MKRQSAAHSDNGDGNGGGYYPPYMPLGRGGEFTSKRETLETESTLIKAQADLWIKSTIAIELCVMLVCILLALTFGGLWVVGGVVTIVASYIIYAMMVRVIESDDTDNDDSPRPVLEVLAPFIVVIAVDVAILWTWPGIVAAIEPKTRWMLLVTFVIACLCGAVVAPYRTLATTMRYKILDFFPQQAVSVPFQAGETTPEEWARWVRANRGDDPDAISDGEGGYTQALEDMREIAESITAKVSAQPIIKRETRIMEGRKNGNGLHLSPTPGSGEKNTQDRDSAVVELDIRPRDSKRIFRIVENGRQSMDVTLGNARYYIEHAWPDKFGYGIRAWTKRGISETQQAVIRRMLEIYCLIEPANGANRDTIKWLVDWPTAMEEFKRLLESE